MEWVHPRNGVRFFYPVAAGFPADPASHRNASCPFWRTTKPSASRTLGGRGSRPAAALFAAAVLFLDYTPRAGYNEAMSATGRFPVWHAVNRNDFRSSDPAVLGQFGAYDVAHIDFELHKRLLMRCPGVKTKALIYTYPAALFESVRQPTGAWVAGTSQSRSFLHYGNPFEYVGWYRPDLLPFLRNKAGQPIVDFPSTGHRYWVDYNRVDIEDQAGRLRQVLEDFFKVETLDNNELLELLKRFGQSGGEVIRWDANRDGTINDADLNAALLSFGRRVSTEPIFYLEQWVEGFFIDNYPEYLNYTKLSGLTTDQQISGYHRFCQMLKKLIPHARLCINCYEGVMFRRVGGTDDNPVLEEPSESILEFIDAVFFENWRWHWASSGGTLAPSAIRTIEQRADWLVAKGKTIVMAVNHAYDQQGYEQRLEAIDWAIRRWGTQVRFSEFRPLYPNRNPRSVVEASRSLPSVQQVYGTS